MSGPKTYMHLAWQELQKHIEMEEPAEAHVYLDCNHTYTDLQAEDDLVRQVFCGMMDYLMSSIRLYQKVCVAAAGKEATLRKVATPFIEEVQARALAKAPRSKRTLY